MKFAIHCILFVAGFNFTVSGVEWRSPVLQMARVKETLKNRAAKVKQMLVREVGKADIRLLRNDPSRTSDSHLLLASASLDLDKAKTRFETDWADFYEWHNNFDSEYKSVYKAHRLFNGKNYNKTLDTLLIMHDACGSARDQSITKVIEALKLRNFDANYNIMVMDFKEFMCKKLSPTVGIFKIGFNPQLKLLAVAIGEFIYKGMRKRKVRAGQMNLIGLGISSHLAALVAKETRILSGKKLNSIIGLDPPVSLRRSVVGSNTVRYVHIYHTFKLIPRSEPSTGHATADFVFGGAKRTPHCRLSLNSKCLKDFGVQLFVTTLLYPDLFPVRWCPDYHKFSEHFCDTNDYTYIAFPPNNSTNGVYQIDISYEFPFGKGLDGIYEKQVEEGNDAQGFSGDVTKMSTQEYFIRLEQAVERIRSELMSCLRGVMSRTAVMRCVMATQPSVKNLVKQQLIYKHSCEKFENSPTGKKCKYETRTHNLFYLPF